MSLSSKIYYIFNLNLGVLTKPKQNTQFCFLMLQRFFSGLLSNCFKLRSCVDYIITECEFLRREFIWNLRGIWRGFSAGWGLKSFCWGEKFMNHFWLQMFHFKNFFFYSRNFWTLINIHLFQDNFTNPEKSISGGESSGLS